MSVARFQLAPVGKTMFPPRALFFTVRPDSRGPHVAVRAQENERGNLPVSPGAPSPAHQAGDG